MSLSFFLSFVLSVFHRNRHFHFFSSLMHLSKSICNCKSDRMERLFFIICPFAEWKIVQQQNLKFAKVGSKFCQVLSILQKYDKILGHTVCQSSLIITSICMSWYIFYSLIGPSLTAAVVVLPFSMLRLSCFSLFLSILLSVYLSVNLVSL